MPPEKIATPELQTLIDDMIETMYAANGIGLAGPQIGVSERIIIAETGGRGGEHKPLALVNPEILKTSWRKVKSEEGCLSIPGVYGIVVRSRGVRARALDREGKLLTIKNSDLLAIILQHEIDHLNGVLFTDKAEKVMPIADRAQPKI
ncbi:peptide deformylase [Candidatus Uhrbacteria bacterium]|nr:peptide deformylase [Candidatus Uhrbacteria bacterium]